MKISDIPKTPHYAIITSKSVYTSGWDAHDSGSTDYFNVYNVYTTRKEWETQIEYLTMKNEAFRAISAHPADVSVKITVDVKTEAGRTGSGSAG